MPIVKVILPIVHQNTLTSDYNDDKFAFINNFPVQAIVLKM